MPSLLLLAAALAAAPTPPAGVAAWNGAWTLDAARSSPAAREAAAPGYAFAFTPAGAVRWEIPALHEVITGRMDGAPMSIRSDGAPPGLTLALRRIDDATLEYTVARGGVRKGGGRMTLVDGGAAWVDVTWGGEGPPLANELVYVRKG
ncbi:MAG: hypothetical protein INR64_11615 [Caulobacteraceae bacterium]|nr:hypothetical protein [Caulobacter sp.]